MRINAVDVLGGAGGPAYFSAIIDPIETAARLFVYADTSCAIIPSSCATP